jgi:hypothetical protein
VACKGSILRVQVDIVYNEFITLVEDSERPARLDLVQYPHPSVPFGVLPREIALVLAINVYRYIRTGR